MNLKLLAILISHNFDLNCEVFSQKLRIQIPYSTLFRFYICLSYSFFFLFDRKAVDKKELDPPLLSIEGNKNMKNKYYFVYLNYNITDSLKFVIILQIILSVLNITKICY